MPRKKKAETAEASPLVKLVVVEIPIDMLPGALGIRGYGCQAELTETGIALTLEPGEGAKALTEFESGRVCLGGTSTLYQHGQAYVRHTYLPISKSEPTTAAEEI